MTMLYLEITNKTYDLDEILQRIEMRDDLAELGFFDVKGYEKMFEVFEKEKVTRDELGELMTAIKLYTVAQAPQWRKRLN